jgi:hypothetical protein
MGKELANAHNALPDTLGLRDVLFKLSTTSTTDQLPSLVCIFNDEATKPLYDLFATYEKRATAHLSVPTNQLQQHFELHDIMYHVGAESVLKGMLNKKKSYFGPSFTTNGVEVHVKVESKGHHFN